MPPGPQSQPADKPSLQLHIIQADYGDCLLLQYSTDELVRHILIDGGPDGIYANHLKFKLQEVADQHGQLDLVVLTHIDEDHVVGLVDMLSEMAQALNQGKAPLVRVSELWYNTFRSIETGPEGTSDLVETMTSYLSSTFAGGEMQGIAYSIAQGEDLWKASHILKLPLNSGFADHLVTTDAAPRPVQLGELKLWIIGPSQANLRRYKKDWDDWYTIHKNDPFSPGATKKANDIDRTASNLSSIMFLAHTPARSILLTGDGRWDSVLAGLKQTGLTDSKGRLHVDVIKVPHHGSSRNTSRKFFELVTASQYVIPAGKHKNDNNPDLETLVWIVESAYKRDDQIEILITNPNDNTTKLQEQYPADKYNYTLTVLSPGQHWIVI